MSSQDKAVMDRNMAIEAVRVTEAAALAAADWVGRGNEKEADAAAVDAMRTALNKLKIEGTVVIGRVSAMRRRCSSSVRKSVLEVRRPISRWTRWRAPRSPRRRMPTPWRRWRSRPTEVPECAGRLHGKIAIGGGYTDGLIDIEAAPAENLAKLAKSKGVDVSELTVCILDRPRHEELITAVREAGARIFLISDGDIFGVMATSDPASGIDMYLGSGGAPEGVLAAAALRSIGGQIQGKLLFRNDDEIARAPSRDRGPRPRLQPRRPGFWRRDLRSDGCDRWCHVERRATPRRPCGDPLYRHAFDHGHRA